MKTNIGLSPNVRLTNFAEHKFINYLLVTVALTADVAVFVYLRLSEKEVIFTQQNLISNGLAYVVHPKSTGELRLTLNSSNC